MHLSPPAFEVVCRMLAAIQVRHMPCSKTEGLDSHTVRRFVQDLSQGRESDGGV